MLVAKTEGPQVTSFMTDLFAEMLGIEDSGGSPLLDIAHCSLAPKTLRGQWLSRSITFTPNNESFGLQGKKPYLASAATQCTSSWTLPNWGQRSWMSSRNFRILISDTVFSYPFGYRSRSTVRSTYSTHRRLLKIFTRKGLLKSYHQSQALPVMNNTLIFQFLHVAQVVGAVRQILLY